MGGRGAYPLVESKPAASTETPAALNHRFGEKMGIAIVPLCQHWMDDSTRCGCPAMKGTRYCYSHYREQARGTRKNGERARQRWFESAPLEDVASVQRALAQVITRF